MRVSINSKLAPMFGTNWDSYIHNGKEIRKNTCCARTGINWQNFVKYIDSHFQTKKHVNIYSLGCSDGSEPLTLAIFIDKYLSNNKKYFPILASDLDTKGIKNIKTRGEINLYSEDYTRLGINPYDNDYFKIIGATNNGYYTAIQNKLTKIAKRKVNFSSVDLLDKINKINDNSNSVIICRNVLPYLYDDKKVEQFAVLCSKKLKNKSLVIVDNYDTDKTNIREYMLDNSFYEIDTNIFEKHEMNILPIAPEFSLSI